MSIITKTFLVTFEVDTEKIYNKYPNFELNYNSVDDFVKSLLMDLSLNSAASRLGYEIFTLDVTEEYPRTSIDAHDADMEAQSYELFEEHKI